MASLAGLYDVVPTQSGSRIRGGVDIVSPMAVITTGSRHRPKSRHLSMEGIEIGCHYVEVAFSALINNFLSKIALVNPLDRV